MNPFHHAESSARKYGGVADDYFSVHSWFDESKSFLADFRHRALRHHAEGIFMAERLFGPTITNSQGRRVPTRFLGEQHVKEDLGRIPSVQDWFEWIAPQPWMLASGKRQPEAPDSAGNGALGLKPPAVVTVSVAGGVVQHVDVPARVRVVVQDYDVEGVAEEQLQTDAGGAGFVQACWEPEESCECELPGYFCCGVTGILAHLENGRAGSPQEVERCDQCQRYATDEEAYAKLSELGFV